MKGSREFIALNNEVVQKFTYKEQGYTSIFVYTEDIVTKRNYDKW